MILLLGGTSETGPLARRLAEAGLAVLVSTATDEPLAIDSHPLITRRCGRLNAAALAELVSAQGIRAIVDAGHPYAQELHQTAATAAHATGVPCLAIVRPAATEAEQALHRVATHDEAAQRAFSFSRPVLLTTGANHLLPYVTQSRRTGLPLAVRVLPRPESLQACAQAGLTKGQIIAAKGPFSLEENLRHIRQTGAGVLVTKDGGDAGGVPPKLQAARLCECQIVLINRPAQPGGVHVVAEDQLVARLQSILGKACR